MNRYEKDEIDKLPEKYRPIGAWGYFGYTILFAIPIIGQLFLIIFALSSGNINRRSFARSYFCVIIIAVVAFLAVMLIGLVAGGALKGGFNLSGIFETIKQFFLEIFEKIKGGASGYLYI